MLKTSQYPSKDQVMIYTFGQNLATSLGGMIGAAAAASAGKESRAKLAETLQQQRIDPGIIMAGAFEEEMAGAPLWSAGAASDATFDFKTNIVGLMIKHGLTTKLSPYLAATGTLRGRDNTVLWQRTSFMVNGHIRHSLDEYLQQPATLRRAYEVTARLLARQFLEELHRDSGTKFQSTKPEPTE